MWSPLGAQAVHWCFFIGSPSLKTSALVSKTQGNAYVSEMQIRNDLTGLASTGPRPALLQLHSVGCFLGPASTATCCVFTVLRVAVAGHYQQ